MKDIKTVSEINQYIKNLFLRDYNLSLVNVSGEVSNCSYPSSGHIYFTLKDANSAIACVMFKSSIEKQKLDFKIEDGMSVVIEGNIGVYEKDGKYQLYARKITKEGSGKLYEEYEKLKTKLTRQGLFDNDHKKKIPKYVSSIGVVTSKSGAVIQDICNVSLRRNRYVQIYLYPVMVQGEGAAKSIIRGLDYFEKSDVDMIIIGRGGGSIEDLWAFNDEQLAHKIYDCNKPVISAVGHQTDTTISDFVADLRVPTPSAAAEMAVYNLNETQMNIRNYDEDLRRCIQTIINKKKYTLLQKTTVLQHMSPEDVIRQRKLFVIDSSEKLSVLMNMKIKDVRHKLDIYIETLKGLSPLYKLSGGYAYVSDHEGKNVDSVNNLSHGDKLNLYLKDGQAVVTVDEIHADN